MTINHFDNVGGATLRTLVGHLAVGARIVLCGAISATATDIPPNLTTLTYRGAHLHGLLLTHHLSRVTQAATVMAGHAGAGRIVTRLDIVYGLAAAPLALLGLFTGANTGKRVVRL